MDEGKDCGLLKVFKCSLYVCISKLFILALGEKLLLFVHFGCNHFKTVSRLKTTRQVKAASFKSLGKMI